MYILGFVRVRVVFMNKNKNISMTVIRRLPKYYRCLEGILRSNVLRISSKELSEKIGFTASQIRQDLNCFGDFGQQGYGYKVKDLFNEISNILGLNTKRNIIIIGAGNLGQALSNYLYNAGLNFELCGIFDNNKDKIGHILDDIAILNIDDMPIFVKENKVDIATICTTSDNAQEVCDKIISNGIKCIWNYTQVDLKYDDNDVICENVHLIDSLMTLSYLLNE